LNGFSDDILVAASRRGDKSAYGILVRRYYRDVFAFCLGVLGDVDDAEDITQDALLKGFLKIRQLRSSERFGSWILRIAKNLSMDSVRRKKQFRVVLSRRAARRQDKTIENHDLHRAIKALPTELRLPLLMYYFDNKDAKTISEKLRISHSGLCQRIRAARQQLHRLLSEEVENDRRM
jgi:RNA polymerase sigma-70 factor (ECF subfamily)